MSRDRNPDQDTFSRFEDGRCERGLFGDNERASPRQHINGRSDLIDVTMILRNDNPAKLAIAVSVDHNTPFIQWIWLARSAIEYEKIGGGAVKVTLPSWLAKDKGLI